MIAKRTARFFGAALLAVVGACAAPTQSSLATTEHTTSKRGATRETDAHALAVVAVDPRADVVGKRGRVSLPNGVTLVARTYKMQVVTVRDTTGADAEPVFEWRSAWRLVGGERGSVVLRDVAEPLPPGDEILWRWLEGERAWESLVVRPPPILTAVDVARAALETQRSTTIRIIDGQTKMTEQLLPVAQLTFNESGIRKLSAWAKAHSRQPIAYVVDGIVVEESFVQGDEQGILIAGSVTLASLGPATTERDLRAFIDRFRRPTPNGS